MKITSPSIMEKWFGIAISTQPVDPNKVISILKRGYHDLFDPSHKYWKRVKKALDSGRVETICLNEWGVLQRNNQRPKKNQAIPISQFVIPKGETPEKKKGLNGWTRGLEVGRPAWSNPINQDALAQKWAQAQGLDGGNWGEPILPGGHDVTDIDGLWMGSGAEIALHTNRTGYVPPDSPRGRVKKKRKTKIHYPELLKWLQELGEAAPDVSYCELLDRILILERPLQYHYQIHNGLFEFHCENGPALEYSNGAKFYYYEGVQVAPWVIEHPETLTVENIEATWNAEASRIMRQLYGEGRYLLDSGAQILDVDTMAVSNVDVCEERAVPRMLVQDNQKNRFLVGTDSSTGRVYYMRVGRRVKTCTGAHNALAGFDEKRIVSQS